MIRVNVTGHGGDLESTISIAKKHGLKVDAVLEAIGVVTGQVAESKFDALARAPGITVERDQHIQIAPPDADVQ